MKKFLLYIIPIAVLFACENGKEKIEEKSDPNPQTSKKGENFGIVLHGGAGTILKENMSDSLENAYKEKLDGSHFGRI